MSGVDDTAFTGTEVLDGTWISAGLVALEGMVTRDHC
jgi:hypothetical protein